MHTEKLSTPDTKADRPARAGRSAWIALIGGLVAFAVVISPPMDEAVDTAFSAHMAQHMVLIDVVAPLLALAWPLLTGRWVPGRLVVGLNALAHPVPALVLSLSTAALWLWHIPAVYDAALAHEGLHMLEHLVFVVAFIFFWRPVISGVTGGGHLRTNGLRVFYLTVGMFANGLLAAYITFAEHLIYPHYAASSPGGRTALADQQLGGAIMWIVGTVAIAAAALLTIRDES